MHLYVTLIGPLSIFFSFVYALCYFHDDQASAALFIVSTHFIIDLWDTDYAMLGA